MDSSWLDDVLDAGQEDVQLTGLVADLMVRNTRFAAWFNGKGKANGDTSARGYDIATARAVLEADGNDGDARCAVLARPDRHAAEMGENYLLDVLRVAREQAKKAPSAAREWAEAKAVSESGDLIERVVLYRTDPPIYAITAFGVTFDTTAACVLNRTRFQVRVAEATNKVMDLPKKKYSDFVRSIFDRAEVVDMPDDASEAGGNRAEVEAILSGMGEGDDRQALDRGCKVKTDLGQECIALRPLAKTVRMVLPQLSRPELCKILRGLGWADVQVRLPGEAGQVRVWRR